MLDDLAGKRTGERIQILRERKGLSRPVLAGLVGMSASWLKGIERGTRLPPRLPLLVKLAEALAVGDVAVLAGIDMDLGWATSVPVASFARIPHDAVPAIRAPQGHARSSRAVRNLGSEVTRLSRPQQQQALAVKDIEVLGGIEGAHEHVVGS
jgi:transcriptional regulator with XRE-family HTH domain